MAVSLLFGWRGATKDAIAVCQRRMPFSRTLSFVVRKYERAVCARAISCWHCCSTARRSLRHAHFIVVRVHTHTHRHTNKCHRNCKYLQFLWHLLLAYSYMHMFGFSATSGAVGVLSGCAGEELQNSMPTCLESQILCFTGESKRVKTKFEYRTKIIWKLEWNSERFSYCFDML